MVCIDHTSFNVRVSLICSIIQDTSSLHTILLTQSISQIQNQAEIDLHSDRKPSLISSFASRRNHLSKFYIPLGMPGAITSGLEESLRTEIALSHVCYQWRSISLAYPNLWTLYCGYVQPEKMASSTESSSSKTKKFSFEELDAYLERPSQLPSDIWLDFSDPDYIVSRLALAIITDPKHAARWRRVS